VRVLFCAQVAALRQTGPPPRPGSPTGRVQDYETGKAAWAQKRAVEPLMNECIEVSLASAII
jgi:hypothetical protein